jgi:hypothetical protein
MGNDKRSKDSAAIYFKIDDGQDIGYFCTNFEWVSFINSGYRITATFFDAAEDTLGKTTIDKLLEKGRNSKDGLDIEFKIYQDHYKKEGKHGDVEYKATTLRKAKIISLDNNISGSLTHSILEIVAIDPTSWYLNKGICSGGAFQGNISSVIKQIVNKYSPKSEVKISPTKDSNKNWWWEMRLDPKTLIASLLEWASITTNTETPLIVQSEDYSFICKEWAELKPPNKLVGKNFYVTSKKAYRTEVDNSATIQIISNNLLTPVATRLYTGAISATTGLYICKDAELPPSNKYVNDTLTPKKLVIDNLESNRSYKKPEDDSEESTLIEPIPEHNNGDVGMKYQDYSIGRARDWFIKLIYSVLRVKITITPGDTDFDSVTGCGAAKIKLKAITMEEDKPYYIDGNWLLYGFRHLWSLDYYQTELMLARTDFDSKGKKI